MLHYAIEWSNLIKNNEVASNVHHFISNKQTFQDLGKFHNAQTALKRNLWSDTMANEAGPPSSDLQEGLWSSYLHG